MDHAFWLKRWQNAETGFHRSEAHAFLTSYWSELALPKASRVFVPLCGKSSDMIWLAKQGHHVVGAELSPVAVDGFFEDLSLTSNKQTQGGLVSKTAGPYELWQGDVFELTRQDVGNIAAIYDRAALVALPSDLQVQYANLLTDLLPVGGHIFLVSLSYSPSEMKGPPFSISTAVVEKLFSAHYDIVCRTRNSDALNDSQNLKQRGLTALTEILYLLTRRS